MLVLYVDFEAVDTPKAREKVLRVHLNFSVGDIGGAAVYLINDALRVVTFALALVPFLEFQSEIAIRR